MGCPIRRSMDQSSFAAPHSLSQRITSFFACACQGIHQMPLRHLIVLIANAHQLACAEAQTARLPFTTVPSHDAIDVFNQVTLLGSRRATRLCLVFRPASRDVIQDRAVRQRSSVIHQRYSEEHQQQTTRVTSFLPLPIPLSYPAG